jgi:hypothetical protein
MSPDEHQREVETIMITRIHLLMLAGILSALPCGAQSFDYVMPTQQQQPAAGNSSVPRARPAVGNRQQPLSTFQMRNGLPPVCTDSFVREAGPMADLIYGDETTDLPPFLNFTPEHRIGAGIFGTGAVGLTTGHYCPLPTTWGGDEFYMSEPLTVHGQQASAPAIVGPLAPMPLDRSTDPTLSDPLPPIDYQIQFP